jgi:GTP-sensing pleiotropic transcriptional regulator CodY
MYELRITKLKKLADIDLIRNSEFNQLVEELKTMFQEKLSKLKLILKNKEVYFTNQYLAVKENIIINDNINLIATSLGMKVTYLSQQSGRLIIISDKLLDVLNCFVADVNSLSSLGKELNLSPIETIQPLIANYNHNLDEEVEKFKTNYYINKILNNFKYAKSLKVDVATSYIGKTKVGQETNTQQFVHAYQVFVTYLDNIAKSHMAHIIEGTSAIIELRAKALGYQINKKQTNDQVELVLVRRQ